MLVLVLVLLITNDNDDNADTDPDTDTMMKMLVLMTLATTCLVDLNRNVGEGRSPNKGRRHPPSNRSRTLRRHRMAHSLGQALLWLAGSVQSLLFLGGLFGCDLVAWAWHWSPRCWNY